VSVVKIQELSATELHIMSAAPKQRLAALSSQLQAPSAEELGTFEGIPRLRKVAGVSAGPRVKGKVIIVTGANSPMGIGRASAHQYAENGAKAIFICDYDGKRSQRSV
jgi:hypothetical protein